jgi:outer membrane lipoprotein-sorting protein
MMRRNLHAAAWAFAGLAIAFCQPKSEAQAKNKDAARNPYEPRAIQLLQEMAEAYSQLKSLRQSTEFTSEVLPVAPLPSPVNPSSEHDGAPSSDSSQAAPSPGGLFTGEHKLDRQLRLSFAAPNRFKLEVEDTDDNGKLKVSRWVCDGKTFWSYNPEKNLFSREKAPGKIRDFAKLAHMTSGSLEVLMLMGVNPFAQIEDQAQSVKYGGKVTVRGVETEVIAMSADLGPQATETRLYIGVEDHLLYRLVSETSQKPKAPRHAITGSPLNELAPPDPADPEAGNPDDLHTIPGLLLKSRVTCDNKIESDPIFEVSDFSYQPPADAYYLTNPIEAKKSRLTLAQRIAEMNRAAVKREKRSTPRPKTIKL